MRKMILLLLHHLRRRRQVKQQVKKFLFKRPKPRNLEAKELYTPRYSLKVIPNKINKIFRKRKHKGLIDEKD
jgi:hypothetical protein